MPRWIELFRTRGLGQVIRTDGPQSHRPKAGTPTMGGLVALLAIALSIVLWARPSNPLIWLCLLALIWFGAVGAEDDWMKLREHNAHELSAALKLLWQFLGAVLIAILYVTATPDGWDRAGMISLPFLKQPVVVPQLASLALAVLVMVGTSNAVNLTDGLDGLAAGCLALTAAGMGVVAYLVGNLKFAGYLRIPFIPDAGELAVVSAI